MGYFKSKHLVDKYGVVRIGTKSLDLKEKLNYDFNLYSAEFVDLHRRNKLGLVVGSANLHWYVIKRLFQKPNKNFVMVGETYFKRESQNKEGSITSAELEHKGILVSEHAYEDGKIIWANKIAKNGHAGTYKNKNFYLHLFKNDLIFIYNDHPDNLNYKGTGKIKMHGGSVIGDDKQISIARMSNEGSLKVEPFFKTENENAFDTFWSWASFQVSENEFLLSTLSSEKGEKSRKGGLLKKKNLGQELYKFQITE